MKSLKNKSSTEHQEQVALFDWANASLGKYPELKWMFAVPNGGKRHIVTAMKMKREGVKQGVPDIFLPVAQWRKEHRACNNDCYHGLFIEMKRLKPKGTTSLEQREWIKALSDQGYAVHVCWGWEAARDVIVDYLEGRL